MRDVATKEAARGAADYPVERLPGECVFADKATQMPVGDVAVDKPQRGGFSSLCWLVIAKIIGFFA